MRPHPAVQGVAGEPFPTAYTEQYKNLAAVTKKNLAITTGSFFASRPGGSVR